MAIGQKFIMRKSYEKIIQHIESQWEELRFHQPQDEKTFIGLPNPYISPSVDIFKQNQFYWDTYFTILGLLESGKIDLARGMVNNLIYLYKKYDIIPSRNKMYNLGISQQPLLTSMALEVYSFTKDLTWLSEVAEVAEKELNDYWLNPKIAECHYVNDLSRYCDHHITHTTAEHESGWDMTSRFQGKCMDVLPIDLNCCIYKYEIDLAHIYDLISMKDKSNKYKERAEGRKKIINDLMWDDSKNFFFDYDYVSKEMINFYSLAPYYSMWAGLATKEQAEFLNNNLAVFECKGGLVSTQKDDLSKELHQWDYPNGWPNLHWIVISGLLKYGFKEQAERIARKWLDTNIIIFEATGKLWEKYDVVNIEVGRSDKRYATQYGFGWTNSVFLKLIKIFNLE